MSKSHKDKLRIYFITGEESGDALGAGLISSFHSLGADILPMGLGGERMQGLGLNSLFDISELSVMGFSGVTAKLPKLLSRIRQTTADVLKKKPDVLLMIDSPEFSYRVAKRVRKKLPDMKIIKYVAPSVWAWRPGRAKKIAGYVDHILAILPFEPELLKKLGGPAATYVGHPLAAQIPSTSKNSRKTCGDPVKLVVLPGSRKNETSRLLPFISQTLQILKERGNRQFEITLPAVTKLESDIREAARDWAIKPNIVTGEEAKRSAFEVADIALAASGTVTLELALYKIPMISIYKLDGLAFMMRHLLTGWTASLPNLIADYPVVPERFNEYAHPQYVARMIERLCNDGQERRLQLEGFELISKRLKQENTSPDIAAGKILELVG